MKSNPIRITTLLLLVLVLCVSCREKRKTAQEIISSEMLQPKMMLSKSDTTEVRSLADHYMELLKNNRIDEAVSLLYYLAEGDSLIRLPEGLAMRQKMILAAVPVLDYRCDGIIFNRETDSQVKYTIEFFKKAPDDKRPNTTVVYLKPVRKDGKWYLTVADSHTHTGKPSEINN